MATVSRVGHLPEGVNTGLPHICTFIYHEAIGVLIFAFWILVHLPSVPADRNNEAEVGEDLQPAQIER